MRNNGMIVALFIKGNGVKILRFIGKFFKFIVSIALIVLLTAGVAIGYAVFIEPNRLVTVDLEDQSTQIKEKLTIAFFADTHLGFEYDLADLQKVTDEINENPPDILIFGGDLIDNLNDYEGSTAEISAALSEMQAKVGKYAVFGNHDYGGGAENLYEDMMNAGGFKVLVNDTVKLDKFNFSIIGIDDVLIGYGEPGIANAASSARYNLALCHEPDIMEEVSHSSVNYMLSGHTHGGQIRIPFYTSKVLPSYGERYVKGSYDVNGTPLYVTPGLGTTKIPARLFAPPELTRLTLSPQ